MPEINEVAVLVDFAMIQLLKVLVDLSDGLGRFGVRIQESGHYPCALKTTTLCGIRRDIDGLEQFQLSRIDLMLEFMVADITVAKTFTARLSLASRVSRRQQLESQMAGPL